MVGHLESCCVLVAQRSKATPGSSDVFKIIGWKMSADVVVRPEPVPSVLVLGLFSPSESVQPCRALVLHPWELTPFGLFGSGLVSRWFEFWRFPGVELFKSCRLGQL